MRREEVKCDVVAQKDEVIICHHITIVIISVRESRYHIHIIKIKNKYVFRL
jgi:hypothetical protein